MIPLMRDVIQTFNACDPAVHWAGDMNVQEGYELCTEPGWLMLLLFSVRPIKNAWSFDHTIQVARECIKPALRMTKDDKLLDSITTTVHWSGINQEIITRDRQYAMGKEKELYEKIRARGLEVDLVTEMYVAKVISMFLGILEHHDNVTVSAKAAHTAIDFVVMALVAEKYPDFIAASINAIQASDPRDVKIFRLAKKVEICRILRSAAPRPFVSYE